jgi:hypothetical protein
MDLHAIGKDLRPFSQRQVAVTIGQWFNRHVGLRVHSVSFTVAGENDSDSPPPFISVGIDTSSALGDTEKLLPAGVGREGTGLLRSSTAAWDKMAGAGYVGREVS